MGIFAHLGYPWMLYDFACWWICLVNSSRRKVQLKHILPPTIEYDVWKYSVLIITLGKESFSHISITSIARLRPPILQGYWCPSQRSTKQKRADFYALRWNEIKHLICLFIEIFESKHNPLVDCRSTGMWIGCVVEVSWSVQNVQPHKPVLGHAHDIQII